MKQDLYYCSICGKDFEYCRTRDYHKQKAHDSKLSDFDDSGELKRLDNMNEALIKNDFDSWDENPPKTTQKTLKGGELTNGRTE